MRRSKCDTKPTAAAERSGVGLQMNESDWGGQAVLLCVYHMWSVSTEHRGAVKLQNTAAALARR